MQLTRTYAAVANGGTLWIPQVAKAVLAPDGKLLQVFAPKKAGRIPVSGRVLAFLQNALKTTTERGTGHGPFARANFPLDQIPVASKTGTGEVYGKETTSWFASYAPADKPRYAVVMMVSQGGTGSGTSGPSVAEIYKKIFGVDSDGAVNRERALFPEGKPPVALPKLPRSSTAQASAPAPADRKRGLASGETALGAAAAGSLPAEADVPDVRRREAGDP